MPAGYATQTSKLTEPDILVVGAGSAGFSAAITAADAGAQVVIAGHGVIGGTCVNVGCVPSKNLIRAMDAIHQGNTMTRFDGIEGSGKIFDWPALVRQKNALVNSLRRTRYEDLLAVYPNISYISGLARFTGSGAAMDIGSTRYHPKKIILATGASPVMPPVQGLQNVPVLDSTSALELERVPESLIIIGGGAVGCELGQLFARAGTEATICCRSRLLPEAEPEASEALVKHLRAEGVNVYQGVAYRKLEQNNGNIKLQVLTGQGETTIDAGQVLVATGRMPNTRDLQPEKSGIELAANGGIKVDDFMQTTHQDVYAAGDLTGRDMLVYMAAYGGKIAARNALNGNCNRYNNSAMPAVVFTDPQLAWAGMTEKQAKDNGFKVKTSVIPLDTVPRFIAARDTRGLIKQVADAESDTLLGTTILASEAGDSIQTVVMALRGGLTTGELADTIFPYLTAVEGLKLAAQSFTKDINMLSCCAG